MKIQFLKVPQACLFDPPKKFFEIRNFGPMGVYWSNKHLKICEKGKIDHIAQASRILHDNKL